MPPKNETGRCAWAGALGGEGAHGRIWAEITGRGEKRRFFVVFKVAQIQKIYIKMSLATINGTDSYLFGDTYLETQTMYLLYFLHSIYNEGSEKTVSVYFLLRFWYNFVKSKSQF